MRIELLILIARNFLSGVLRTKSIYGLFAVILVLLYFAASSGLDYFDHNHHRTEHQHMARESWEANPDKHPHRMAHFGTFAFRLKHPLSLFDFGLESFTGNALFLEAHKQNTVNFSEASLTTGLLRFGELSMAMILQIITPLIIFFVGYSAVVNDRENGTLKILITQGARWKEILFGRTLGLFTVSVLVYFPFIFVISLLLLMKVQVDSRFWLHWLLVCGAYLIYLFILSSITILISTTSHTAKNALVTLLGLWLLMTVLIPRTAQSVGSYFHPAPTKLAFRAAVEKEVLEIGDSHNTDDPHFSHLRDSLLQAYHVQSVEDLPFNYGGYVMSIGEKISADIYAKHQEKLVNQFRRQNELTQWLSLVNPYLAIKNLSMSLCGTDFESYVSFQQQAEAYRYLLAQHMNELQMKYINPGKVHGSEGKVHVVDRREWEAFPDFEHTLLEIGPVIKNSAIAIIALGLWLFIIIGAMNLTSHKAKAI